jgi:hypothetical protein
MAPDGKGARRTIQAETRSVENEFKFLPGNLLKPST